jgi:hypothetical protein
MIFVCSTEKEEHQSNTTVEQNYLQFNDQSYKQKEGLAIGATATRILAETFAQNLENTKDNLQCGTKTQKQHRILHSTTREF